MTTPDARYPLIAPTEIQPQPLPTHFACAEVIVNKEKWTVLQLTTANGVQFYWFPSEQAKQVGRMIQQTASGIILAGPADLPPRPRPA